MENDRSHIVDALRGLVWTALPDGQVDFLNRQWREFTDSDQREQWQTAIHPDDLPELLTRRRRALAADESAYRWCLFRVRPLADASGQVVSQGDS